MLATELLVNCFASVELSPKIICPALSTSPVKPNSFIIHVEDFCVDVGVVHSCICTRLQVIRIFPSRRCVKPHGTSVVSAEFLASFIASIAPANTLFNHVK